MKSLNLIGSFLALASPLLGQTGVHRGGSASMLRGDPQHTGASTTRLFGGQGGVHWQVHTGGPVRSSPAVTAARSAGAWVREYRPDLPGSGYVQLWGMGASVERLPMIRAAAEYGLLRRADRSSSADSMLVLRGGEYLDLRAGVMRPNGSIVVRGGRVVEIRPSGKAWRPPAGARVVELEGRSILPGLIDAHVHLTISGDPGENAAATLRAGFTTVVDLGSAGGAGVRLRDSIAAGRLPGPRVIAAGSWIGSKGGVCEFGGATVAGVEEARARAQADLEAGADLLKVCVTGWPAEAVAFPDSIELKAGLLAAVRAVGNGAGRPVYAHAIGRAGALLAAAGGVRALAHTPIVDSADAARLATARIPVISTLATLTARPEGERVRQSFRLLRRAGVPIVLGTDAGVLPHGSNAKELVALTEAGLSPLEALRAATLNAAALLDTPGTGEIAVGAAGDFVVIEGDPLQDVHVLERPVLVIKAGRVVDR